MTGLLTAVLLTILLPGTGWCDKAHTEQPSGMQQLGAIKVDRASRRLTVPGRFLLPEPQTDPAAPPAPGDDLLEYLAVKRDGFKAYEALIELDTTAAEFNLACILIGFDADRATLPEHHFDPQPLAGDTARIWVEWEQDGKTQRVPPARLILVEGEPVTDDDWVYTGSTFIGPGQYLAEHTGALIGFVHDADSIIEHRRGIGLDSPHPPRANLELLPPMGTPVRVILINQGTDIGKSGPPRSPAVQATP